MSTNQPDRKRTMTIVIPDGYESPEALAADCGFEIVPPMPDTAIALLQEIRDTTPIAMQRKRIDAFFADRQAAPTNAGADAE